MAPPLHPLPANPTTGQQPLASLGGRGAAAGAGAIGSGAGSGGVNRETLKGLQDVYWSEDEDDPDCLLCAEPLDLSDLNFKPCQCGLQICQFCYNKLLSTDARCPGCRRPYDSKAVVFQPVDWEEVKKAKERKTKRAKMIKQLTAVGRRHLLGVRIVMKNMAYVVGMKLPAPGDEAIPVLRSNEYFGQYGKISKLYLGDRTKVSSSSVPAINSADSSTSTGIYIVYIRREDASRCISSLDGIPAPHGPPGALLKATYGTTRYCEAFLRGTKCDNSSCHNLHEWGGDSDCFTKEDFDTAMTKPAEYDARLKQTQTPVITLPALTSKVAWPKPSAEDTNGGATSPSTGLPNAASWGKGIAVKAGRTTPSRPAKIGASLFPLSKNNAAFPLPTPSPTIPTPIKEKKEKKSSAMARGRSNDSAQSMATRSNETSPKRKGVPPLTSVKAVAAAATASSSAASTPAPEPPTPVSAVASAPAPPADPTPPPAPLPVSAPAPAPSPPAAEEPVDEQASADSDAGPSSDSPAPQTPARIADDIPPAPLSSEPIFIHSPYPEPIIFTFPAHDKDFAFSLGLDEGELQRMHAQAEGYEPSPFSKTLEGLAELGVHVPEMPDLFDAPISPRTDSARYDGLFRPFETDEHSPPLSDSTPGPSSEREEEVDDDHNAQRTESRFGFARTSSGLRGQSPFGSVRRQAEQGPGLREREGWWRSEEQQQAQAQQQHETNVANLAAQVANFVGSFGSSASGAAAGGAAESGWNGEGYAPSPSRHQQQQRQMVYDSRGSGRMDHGALQGQYMQRSMRERDEYDGSGLIYGQAQIYGSQPQPQQQAHQQQQQQQRAMFSPDSATHSIHEDYQPSPMAFSQLQQAQAQQQQQTPLQHHPDARQLMQMHQRRGQSPGPMAAHGYRRF